jgi:hypothetical protein
MRRLLLLCACLLALGAGEWQPEGWLKSLRDVASAREHRAVQLILVSSRDAGRRSDTFASRAALRDPITSARIFAPDTLGYAHIPARPNPVVVFINTGRVAPDLVGLVAAHELGHVLLHSRGFLQVLAWPGTTDEPLIADAFNVVQDVLLERELTAQAVDSQALLTFQLRELTRTMTLAGPLTAVSGSGREKISHLATLVARLCLTVRGMENEKQQVRRLLPREVAALADRYVTILAGEIATPAQYREAIYQACDANGVRRSSVRFAPD